MSASSLRNFSQYWYMLELCINHSILLWPSITNHVSSPVYSCNWALFICCDYCTLTIVLSINTIFLIHIFWAFLSKHLTSRHLALIIHVWTLFILCTSSARTLGSKYSCSIIIYVTYIERHNNWLQSFIFFLSFMLRTSSIMPIGSKYSCSNIIYVTYVDHLILFRSHIELVI